MLSTDQTEAEFTPPSLRGLDRAPVFRFKQREPRDEALFGHFTARHGLRAVAEGEIRVEIFGILKARWSPETFAEEYPAIRELWAHVDQGEALAPVEHDALADLVERCRAVSPNLDLMLRERDRFHAEAPAFALAFLIKGWSNIALPFAIEAGTVPGALIASLVGELHAIEEAAIAAGVRGVEPGLALMELAAHAIGFLVSATDQPCDPIGEAA